MIGRYLQTRYRDVAGRFFCNTLFILLILSVLALFLHSKQHTQNSEKYQIEIFFILVHNPFLSISTATYHRQEDHTL
jgi:hypothetical protein